MASARIDWGGTDRVVRANIGTYGQAVKDGMFRLGQQWAATIEASAKTNAPWTDRSGAARQGLTGRAITLNNGDTVVIVLFHTMDYGVHLELRNQGRYAIIAPTLQAHYAPVWASYKRLVGAR